MGKAVKTNKKDLGTRDQILSCAAEMFRKQGYAAVSLRSIASGVGMTTGSLYYHFASKEEIVSEILDQGHRRCLQEVKRAVTVLGANASGREILKTAILVHIECLSGEDSFPSANIRIFAHVPPEIRAGSLAIRHEYERYWTQLLKKCQQRGEVDSRNDPAVLSNLLFGAMNWTIEWFRPSRHDIHDIAETISRLVIGTSSQAKSRRSERASA